MSRIVPNVKIDRVQFYENHLSLFSANASAIGTTAGDVTLLTTRTVAARAAYDAQQVAADAAKNTTAAFYDAVAAMSAQGAAIIKQIRAKADITNNPGVYTLAGIPAPATPATKAKPGTPFDFKIELEPNGTLMFKWKCNNPPGVSGTFYQVYRRSTPTDPYTYLGGNGAKTFTDETVPAGATQLTYQVQAVRTNSVGVFAEFNVNFGTNAGGGTFATFSEVPAKLAA